MQNWRLFVSLGGNPITQDYCKSHTISNRTTSLSKKYDKCGEYCIYQYSKIEGADADFENLYQRIRDDLILAESIMRDNNNQPFKEKAY